MMLSLYIWHGWDSCGVKVYHRRAILLPLLNDYITGIEVNYVCILPVTEYHTLIRSACQHHTKCSYSRTEDLQITAASWHTGPPGDISRVAAAHTTPPTGFSCPAAAATTICTSSVVYRSRFVELAKNNKKKKRFRWAYMHIMVEIDVMSVGSVFLVFHCPEDIREKDEKR